MIYTINTSYKNYAASMIENHFKIGPKKSLNKFINIFAKWYPQIDSNSKDTYKKVLKYNRNFRYTPKAKSCEKILRYMYDDPEILAKEMKSKLHYEHNPPTKEIVRRIKNLKNKNCHNIKYILDRSEVIIITKSEQLTLDKKKFKNKFGKLTTYKEKGGARERLQFVGYSNGRKDLVIY